MRYSSKAFFYPKALIAVMVFLGEGLGSLVPRLKYPTDKRGGGKHQTAQGFSNRWSRLG